MKKSTTNMKRSGQKEPGRKSEQPSEASRQGAEERNERHDEAKERVIDVNHISNRARKSFHNDGPGGGYEGF